MKYLGHGITCTISHVQSSVNLFPAKKHGALGVVCRANRWTKLVDYNGAFEEWQKRNKLTCPALKTSLRRKEWGGPRYIN